MGKVGISNMYSIHQVAKILGISRNTVKRWLKLYGIELTILETDRKRAYISDDDMEILVNHIYKKVQEDSAKNSKLHKDKKEVIIIGDRKYYSFAKAASLLDVSVDSIRNWSNKDGIEQKMVMTDRKRGYISHDDTLRIAHIHKCKVSSSIYEDIEVQGEFITAKTDMDQLYSIRDASLCLDVTIVTVKRWIKQHNIEKRTKFNGRDIICITYRDIRHLAELHGREVVPHPPRLTVTEEIEQIKRQLKEVFSIIDDIKHDFRLFVRRSIYIGGVSNTE